MPSNYYGGLRWLLLVIVGIVVFSAVIMVRDNRFREMFALIVIAALYGFYSCTQRAKRLAYRDTKAVIKSFHHEPQVKEAPASCLTRGELVEYTCHRIPVRGFSVGGFSWQVVDDHVRSCPGCRRVAHELRVIYYPEINA
jgi:hypothetical protein